MCVFTWAITYRSVLFLRTYLCSPLPPGTQRSNGRETLAGAVPVVGCTRGSRGRCAYSSTPEAVRRGNPPSFASDFPQLEPKSGMSTKVAVDYVVYACVT